MLRNKTGRNEDGIAAASVVRLIVCRAMAGALLMLVLPPSTSAFAYENRSEIEAANSFNEQGRGEKRATAAQTQSLVVPDLQPLEQKTQELQISTLRFSAVFDFGTIELAKGLPAFPVVIGGSGELRLSPLEGHFSLGLFGENNETRLIGHTVYRYERSISDEDGGRPWVRAERKSTNKATGITPAWVISGEEPAPEALHPFAALIQTFNTAQDITEIGPAVVEGQAVTGFEATLDTSGLFKGETEKMLRQLGKGAPATAKLDLFIAPNGLPVRTNVIVQVGSRTVALTFDVVAVNIPVSVLPPPPSKTVDQAELHHLQKRYRERQRRRIRACLRQLRQIRRHHRHHLGLAHCASDGTVIFG